MLCKTMGLRKFTNLKEGERAERKLGNHKLSLGTLPLTVRVINM